MADYAIDADQVLGTQHNAAIASETIDAGMCLYIDTTTRQAAKAFANAAASADVRGIALNSASQGQPVFYQTSGVIDLRVDHDPGHEVFAAPGTPVFLSATAGKMCPVSDVLPDDGIYPTLIGFSIDEWTLRIVISASGMLYGSALP